MSLPLIDFRGKVTPETDAVLESIQRTTGKDKSEIARDWMHKIAMHEIHASIELHKILNHEGLTGAHEGGQGK
jgi:hypothetical protein